MSELDLLRNTTTAPPPASPQAQARAQARLFAKIDAVGHKNPPSWLLSMTGAGATAAVAAVVFLSIGGGGSVNAAAATVLHKAAKAALAQPGLGTLEPGQYIYTESVDAGMDDFYPGNNSPESSFSVFVSHTRDLAQPERDGLAPRNEWYASLPERA